MLRTRLRLGGQVASVAYIVAGLLALLSFAGLVHALRTSKDETFAGVSQANVTTALIEPAGV